MVKLTVNQRCCLIGRLDARMRIHDNIDPLGRFRYVNEGYDNHLFISIHWEIKKIELSKKIST